jgi:hypothetical protein
LFGIRPSRSPRRLSLQRYDDPMQAH